MAGERSIIVPVSYATLHERKFAEEYMALCRQIELPARGSILFEVCGLARDVPQLRLEEVVSYLAPFSHHRVIRAFSTDTRFSELHHCRVAMVSIAARRSHHTSDKGARSFDGFISSVHSTGGCKLLVRDIDNEASARWYSARGADFLCYAWSHSERD